MKNKLLVLHILFLISYYSFSQSVGIGTTAPNASAALDITNTSKGLLIPRMSITGINAITNPARGLLVYDSAANQLMVNTGTAAAPNWQTIVAKSVWGLTGNSGINPANQFIGNTDNQPLHFRINNIQAGELHPATGNIFWGLRAGQGNTTGFSNIAIGTDALKLNTVVANVVAIGDSALFNNGGANFNVAIGSKSLFSNTTGNSNTAIGFESLRSNTTGITNTANGTQALLQNTTGSGNTASGFQSLFKNFTGNGNTAFGFQSLFSNGVGFQNTAVGDGSLVANITGFNNTAVGRLSLPTNTTGNSNTAIGVFALSKTSSNLNTGIGNSALAGNMTGGSNTALGDNAGSFFNLGDNNTFIGSRADVSQGLATNCVALGAMAKCTASDQVRFGNTATTSIGGIPGYTQLSDGRYKKNIQEGVKGIDFIMKLRPVTYQLDITGLSRKLNESNSKEMDELSKKSIAEKEKTIFSGFVAQEVEQAGKDAGYDFSGVDKPKNENDMYGLRYAEFVVPLVKAVQEQQQMIDDLKKQNTDLQKRVLALEKK